MPQEPKPVNAWSTPKSPWGQQKKVEACSLNDVMSEELASHLQKQQENKLAKRLEILAPAEPQIVQPETLPCETEEDINAILAIAGETPETCDDMKIAQMLQLQFDREHNTMLEKQAEKFNNHSKVSISLKNFKVSHTPKEEDGDEDDDDEDSDDALPEVVEHKSQWRKYQFNKGGLTGHGKDVMSKHDAVLCGRKNAEKIMQFPPDFLSGDAEKMDLRLPNHVFNKLRHYSRTGNKQFNRLHEKQENATAEHAVDPRTRILLFKLVNAEILESITGAISGGKEAAVFHAYGGKLEEADMPSECAIKIFKTTLNEFKNRQDYIKGDHRFSKDDFKKQNPRKTIRIWAEKETANLNRMRKFDMPSPRVVALKKHVLVMTFIGENGQPAPKLKDVRFNTEDIQDAYEQTITIMKKFQDECCLVHADLSEFNLLWHDGKVWVIDVSQAVDLTHPKAFEFLFRDCQNICKFFDKSGVVNVLQPEELFNEITAWDVKGHGADFLSQMRRYEKETSEANLALENRYHKKQYAFDFYWDLSQQQREKALSAVQLSDSDQDEDES
ncbi:hypothetical protein SNE40_022112 [Patella caerulea]|uniref:Serine/threonine-protein kinase RIO3 n=1 Tax=Patella caerulea TaxID=87958 RepID=A0AAN8GCI3_PATCE